MGIFEKLKEKKGIESSFCMGGDAFWWVILHLVHNLAILRAFRISSEKSFLCRILYVSSIAVSFSLFNGSIGVFLLPCLFISKHHLYI